jgi:hypothetical protein
MNWMLSQKIIKNNVRKESRWKFNGGNKGCGRKSKSDERQLVKTYTTWRWSTYTIQKKY